MRRGGSRVAGWRALSPGPTGILRARRKTGRRPGWPAAEIAFGLALALGLAGAALADPPAGRMVPARVVSMNLCTDQLAMLLAAPGQLVSVSHLARDPRSSVMVAEAAAYPVNRGAAEQVFLLRPDLVLAGTYTARPAVELLRRLGVAVVELPPVTGLDGIPAQIHAVGAALGQDERAAALVAEFTAGLAALRRDGGMRPGAVLYHPNGYTVGAGTLGDDILRVAGFANVAAQAGVSGGSILPLERLVLAAPDLVVTSAPYPGAARAEEVLAHPALGRLRAQAATRVVSDAEWVCGLPQVLRAVATMAAAHDALTARAAVE